MQNQAVDNLLLESLVSTTSLESLAKGYILNCETEGKSPKTIARYAQHLFARNALSKYLPTVAQLRLRFLNKKLVTVSL
jgi:hypothetical protein